MFATLLHPQWLVVTKYSIIFAAVWWWNISENISLYFLLHWSAWPVQRDIIIINATAVLKSHLRHASLEYQATEISIATHMMQTRTAPKATKHITPTNAIPTTAISWRWRHQSCQLNKHQTFRSWLIAKRLQAYHISQVHQSQRHKRTIIQIFNRYTFRH